MMLRAYIAGLGARRMSAFAREVGVSPSTMYRYACKGVIPGKAHMERIVAATNGAVTPSDFYAKPRPRRPRRAAGGR